MRTYTDAERVHAVGLALALGDDRAAELTGYPRRSISRWKSKSGPDLIEQATAARKQTAAEVSAELWDTLTEGIVELRKGIRNPKARLSDKATALRVIVETHRLLTNQSTQNLDVHGTTTYEPPAVGSPVWRANQEFKQWLDTIVAATDEELAEAMPTLLPYVAMLERESTKLIESGATVEEIEGMLADELAREGKS